MCVQGGEATAAAAAVTTWRDEMQRFRVVERRPLLDVECGGGGQGRGEKGSTDFQKN